jgi:hypothetical protein
LGLCWLVQLPYLEKDVHLLSLVILLVAGFSQIFPFSNHPSLPALLAFKNKIPGYPISWETPEGIDWRKNPQ